jgi:hypothetical protein
LKAARVAKGPDSPVWVVLREGFAPVELEYLQRLTGAIKLKSGHKLRALQCTKFESESYYLRVELAGDADDAPVAVRIPHAFVLTIVGEEGERAPGFLTSFDVE